MTTLDLEVVPELARKYLAKQLDEFLTLAECGPRNPTIFNVEKEQSDAVDREGAYRSLAVAHDDTVYIQGQANELLTSSNYDPETTSKHVRSELVHSLCRAEAEVMRIYAAVLRGDYANAVIRDPLFAGSVPDDPLVTGIPQQKFTMKDAVERFLEAKEGEVAAKSLEDLKRLCLWIVQWFGETMEMGKLTVNEVRGFRDQLSNVPASNSKPLNFCSAKSATGKGISLQTQKKYFGLLKAFFNWALEEGYIEKSPVGTIKVSGKTGRKSDKRPFSKEELNSLLQSPVCTGFKSLHHWSQPGKVLKQTPDFWCLMIGMLSGMRLGEIVTLRKGNVREEGGILVFEINDDAQDKTVKSSAGFRLVPVHPQLIELGLLDWIKVNCKGAGNKPLFPTLISNRKGDPGNKASKRVNRYLEAVGIKTDKTISFHCFRHAFIDQLKNAKTEEYLIHKIVGHADQTVTALYGNGPDVKSCLEAISKCHAELDYSLVKVKPI